MVTSTEGRITFYYHTSKLKRFSGWLHLKICCFIRNRFLVNSIDIEKSIFKATNPDTWYDQIHLPSLSGVPTLQKISALIKQALNKRAAHKAPLVYSTEDHWTEMTVGSETTTKWRYCGGFHSKGRMTVDKKDCSTPAKYKINLHCTHLSKELNSPKVVQPADTTMGCGLVRAHNVTCLMNYRFSI